jgi:hypothetical protein
MKLFRRTVTPVIPASLQQLDWFRVSKNVFSAKVSNKTYLVNGFFPNKVAVINSHGSSDFKVRGVYKYVSKVALDVRPTL